MRYDYCSTGERQANFPCKEASQSVIEIMVSITDTTIIMKI